MEMLPISNSTKISAVGFDPNTQTMVVEFHGGTKYQYDAVSPELFDGLRTAESVGKFHHQNFYRKHNEHPI